MLRTIAVCALALALTGCKTTARTDLHNGDMALMGKDYATAIKEYDKGLSKEPDSVVLRYGKAKALYGQKKWAEARTLFEEFLKLTETKQHDYIMERKDAAFYRDRCRQELGETVEQDPSKIPPPPMGE